MINQGTMFTGNVFMFYSYDVGDDINLEKIKENHVLTQKAVTPSKHFKNYHIPLNIELPQPQSDADKQCISAKLHNFGVMSLVYKVPFHESLESLRVRINDIESEYSKQSIVDAGKIFKLIKDYIKQSRFFHLRNSYVVIQVNPTDVDTKKLKDVHGSTIASVLRFETETLSEYQKNEILDSAIGYYRGDLIIIDTEAAFVYDDTYEEYLEFFEFGTIQQLELQFFDRVLDLQLNSVYKREVKTLPFTAYLPFIGSSIHDPTDDLGKLRVDISVITEQLESSIKLPGEAFYSELYSLIVEKLDIKNWRDSINRKLEIVVDIRNVYQNKVDAIREDLLSVLIIVLIAIELGLGILSYFK
ncbi:hypothetical protein M1446_02490 [Candidatus Dependentiae bacterium]|nr:hypothetical protein [Candidatus Dependentiae bacterium]